MHASGLKSLPSIGFLTVVEQDEQKFFGGYLLLNTSGRPLEFHCTAPVKANRAQQILYGPTLKPYLYGEQIGQTLLAKAKLKPLFVCVDLPPALTVRQFVSTPVVLLQTPSEKAEQRPNLHWRIDESHAKAPVPSTAGLVHFSLGQHQLAVATTHAGDREKVIDCWQSHASELDLNEPFGRIRDAIEETLRHAAQ